MIRNMEWYVYENVRSIKTRSVSIFMSVSSYKVDWWRRTFGFVVVTCGGDPDQRCPYLPYINKRWDKSFLHSSPPPYQPPSLSSNSGQSSGIFGNMRQKCGDKPIICISCKGADWRKTLLSCVSSACVLPFSTIVFRVLPFSTVSPICVFCFLTLAHSRCSFARNLIPVLLGPL